MGLVVQFDDISADGPLSSSEHSSKMDSNSNSIDPNNNNSHGYDETVSPAYAIKENIYSLRPRSMRRITQQQLQPSSSSSCHPDQNQEPNSKQKKNKSHHFSKQKQKSPPLSRYRRKTANARERDRMREMNQAFETLRQVVPHMQTSRVPSGTNEKLTKITTLRLAMQYISNLNAALNNKDFDDDLSTFGANNNYDLDCLLLESDGESLSQSDHSLLTSPDFPESSLSPVDFCDPCLPTLLQTDFVEHALDVGDLGDFSDFFLT